MPPKTRKTQLSGVPDGGALGPLGQTRPDARDSLVHALGELLAGGHVLDGGLARLHLILAQENDIGDAQLVGVADLLT